MSTEAICSRIDGQSCRIQGETFLFEVRSASFAAGQPDQAVLELAAFRRTASGPALAVTMRVTSPLHELERVPSLLKAALEEWLFRTTPPVAGVH